jgi:hypothetical protein
MKDILLIIKDGVNNVHMDVLIVIVIIAMNAIMGFSKINMENALCVYLIVQNVMMEIFVLLAIMGSFGMGNIVCLVGKTV